MISAQSHIRSNVLTIVVADMHRSEIFAQARNAEASVRTPMAGITAQGVLAMAKSRIVGFRLTQSAARRSYHGDDLVVCKNLQDRGERGEGLAVAVEVIEAPK